MNFKELIESVLIYTYYLRCLLQQYYIIFMSQKIYLIRHAETYYNIVNRQAREKDLSRDQHEHICDPTLVDSILSPQGVSQCESAISHIHSLPITKVFVSPLRRALQTCQILFSTHPAHPSLIVHPDLHEVFSTAHDISLFNSTFLQDYPEFDWTLMPPNFESWTLSDDQYKSELVSSGTDIPNILAMMRKYGRLESHQQLFIRAQKTKETWKKYQQTDTIALLSHSSFLREFSKLSDFSEIGLRMMNCECVEYNII